VALVGVAGTGTVTRVESGRRRGSVSGATAAVLVGVVELAPTGAGPGDVAVSRPDAQAVHTRAAAASTAIQARRPLPM
jgi:hypothetical protein